MIQNNPAETKVSGMQSYPAKIRTVFPTRTLEKLKYSDKNTYIIVL